MARYYTQQRMLAILHQLGISPVGVEQGISTEETARLLTWRAKAEQGIDYTYTSGTVRSRVFTNSLIPIGGKQSTSRYNTYRMEDVFQLSLVPRRGKGQPTKLEKN